jgi:hypothetical protein
MGTCWEFSLTLPLIVHVAISLVLPMCDIGQDCPLAFRDQVDPLVFSVFVFLKPQGMKPGPIQSCKFTVCLSSSTL